MNSSFLMKFALNRKSMVKFGKYSLSIISSIFLFGYFLIHYVVPIFAAVLLGGGPYTNETGSLMPVWVNLTNHTDMFFANGQQVFIVANFSCAPPAVCNSSMIADANFTEIGGNAVRPGIYKTNSSDGSWVLFEFNDTIALSNIQMIQAKMVYVNASAAYNASENTTGIPLMAPVLVVNMSTFGCPPDGDLNIQFPMMPGWNISAPLPGIVQTPIQAFGCTQNATLCQNMDLYGPGTFDDVDNQWKVCAPTFGPATTNLTAIAESGNMSAIQGFTIEAQGKGKIVFNTNVSFASRTEASAVMEFGMKSLMSGGKIGMNDSEWNGTGGRPNLNLSATLTIYNISQYGIIGKGRPQIWRFPTHRSSVGATPCPSNICSGFTWDGENISFTVSSFSDYGLSDSINVTLTGPLNGTITSPSLPLDATYPANRINFTFTPDFAVGVTPQNCTLYGNFTDTWAANATNQTALVSGSVNGIVNNVTDGHYKWNVYCYDTSGQYDYEAYNSTLIVAIPPIVNNTVPANGSYIQATSSRLFQVNVYDYNLNTSNVSLYYNDTDGGVFTRLGLTCYGTAPSFVCNTTRDLSTKATGYEIRHYFEATDNATNYANNGTAYNPWITTIDNDKPTYTNWATNVTNATTIRKGTIIGLSAQWNDNYVLDKYILSSNETGSWVNQTAVAFTTGNWSNVSIDTSSFSVGILLFQAKIYANDSANNQNVTTVFQWTVDGSAPTYTNNGTNDADNVIGKYDSILLFANWTDNIDLDKAVLETNESGTAENKTVYSSPFDINLTAGQTWSNFTWSNSSVAVGTVIAWRIFANDTSGNTNSTPLLTFTIDSTTPKYGNESATPTSPTEYAPGKTYVFNISWSDNVGISKVIFEANFTSATLTNYTDSSTPAVTSSGSNNYSITFTDLSANATANYTYRWYANDTSGNWNSTSYIVYNITKNQTNPVNLYLNGTLNSNLTVIYPAQVNATALAVYSNSGTVNLYRNDTNKISENNTNIRLGNATYLYIANITGNANYSANLTGEQFYVFVNKGTHQITIFINGLTSATYVAEKGVAVNITIVSSATIDNVTSAMQIFTNFSGSNASIVNLTGAGNSLFNITNTSQLSVGNFTISANATYTVNFSATSNNTIILFVKDSTMPTITSFTLTKTDTIYVGYSLTSSDFSCTATDNDSPLTTSITGLDTSTDGTKTATCTVTDPSGNSATKTVNYVVYSAYSAPPPSSPSTTATQIEKGKARASIPSIAANGVATVTISKETETNVNEIKIAVKNKAVNIGINIIKLAEKPTDVTVPTGIPFVYINIVVDNLPQANLNNATVKFFVPKTWIQQNSIDENRVYLNRYANNQWNRLDAKKVSEDNESVYYEAITPGFSYFAISGEKVEAAPITCPTCPPASAWSDCVNNKQTRTNYKCSAETNYQCQSYTEEQDCPVVGIPPIEEIPKGRLTLFIVLILAVIVGLLVWWKKRQQI